LNARIALGSSRLRRIAAAAALVAGFAAGSAPARADDTTIGGYTVTTDPNAGGSTDSYGTGSYGTGSSTGSYGTGSYGTGSSPDSYGTGSSGQ
jgi:hypothetical protein